jgi:hypothetical protein
MRTANVALLALAATSYGLLQRNNDIERPLDLLPRQANVTCPATPNSMPKAAAFLSVKTMPDPFLYLDGKTRVQRKEEWI